MRSYSAQGTVQERCLQGKPEHVVNMFTYMAQELARNHGTVGLPYH
ncbi:MAG: hypothetical protein R2822_07870 [Spirosomataceae bacterium]